jgi:L-fuculose-phosphate aldolase
VVSEILLNERKDIHSIMMEIIDIGQNVVERGLTVGSGGNLSFRVPGTEVFFITGTGTQLDKLTPESFAQVDLSGEHISGIKPSSEFRVHLESYKARTDVDVCVHLHPQASVLTAALNLDIKFLTIDHVYYVREVVRIPWIQSGTQEIADATFEAVKSSNVVILENHGCVVLGPTPQLAYARALNLEEASELTLRCLSLGIDPTIVPQPYWEYLRDNNL